MVPLSLLCWSMALFLALVAARTIHRPEFRPMLLLALSMGMVLCANMADETRRKADDQAKREVLEAMHADKEVFTLPAGKAKHYMAGELPDRY
jgi:hypothetical protein